MNIQQDTRFLVLALLALGLLGCASGVHRDSGADRATGYIFGSVEFNDRTYPYTVYVPRAADIETDDRTPGRGLVFLHGAGECGTDGSKPLAVGLPPAVMLESKRWPFVVLIPQKPTWESEWEDHEGAVLAMLDRVIDEHGVDPDRVAITGLSQGGHGTIALASRNPERFRAAAPVCGYVLRWWTDGKRGALGPPATPERRAEADRIVRGLSTVPVWFFHGGKDNVVPPGESEWLHDAMLDAGHDSTLTIFPGDNHNSWDSAYRGGDLAAWLVEMTE